MSIMKWSFRLSLIDGIMRAVLSADVVCRIFNETFSYFVKAEETLGTVPPPLFQLTVSQISNRIKLRWGTDAVVSLDASLFTLVEEYVSARGGGCRV
jgi:hypothetical protein